MSFQLNLNDLPKKYNLHKFRCAYYSLVMCVVPPGLKVRLHISLAYTFYENFKQLFVFDEVNNIQTT